MQKNNFELESNFSHLVVHTNLSEDRPNDFRQFTTTKQVDYFQKLLSAV